ncbi:DNA cytosine methyltransferase [Phormidium sp. CCY1219]|uniref:DNA cytosine methyltransferase n=1 Tax=Phormidium sp. CCY1219 TaxID=2886104 RepID=UPI002D1F899A|nr:DNA cytosine methyltransferase [Phormidium sp. CCY1219]MEB3829186.1 DNA cytosine methyltransferase [Phormidium sp. CCY1219]
MNNNARPIAVDLFAGAGGMTLGFEQAGFDVLAAVEVDPVHCAIHCYNFPLWKVFCKSVEEMTGGEIRDKSSIGDRAIDVVFGGPPCQGFSTIGKRAEDDPRNSLVFHFIRLVGELQPKFFVMENVRGMTLGKHQEFLGEIIDKFQYYGYTVTLPYKILNAAHYGVPQNRERLFLIGGRQELLQTEELKYPPPVTQPPRGSSNLPATPTVWEAIADLPAVENYSELRDRDWIERATPEGCATPVSPYARQMRGETPLDRDYAYPRQYNHTVLTGCARTNHSPGAMERFAKTLPGKTEPVSRFHKLDPQGICNTLRAGTPSNRGAFTSPRPIHPIAARCITIREAARLHSYPDWFRFHATKWHGFRQIGNSVPPLLAASVAAQIMERLGDKPLKPTLTIELANPELLGLNMSAASKHFGVDPHTIAPRTRGRKQN